ncbi:MAG: PorV/PorQ family protein [Ignavibacteriales bacterium]|nr:PorV/PorQ family protein [Ignavibacteriales bacterium]
MKRILFIIAASYGLMTSTSISQTGNTGLTFLKFGAGARTLAMGEAFVAVNGGPVGTYYNPATIATDATAHLLFMHNEGVQDRKTEYLASITGWNDFSFGLSVNKTSVNNIPLRQIAGDPFGMFDAQNASIGLSSAYEITSLISVGVTGKFLYEKIYVDDASGYAIDLGALYKSPWNTQFGLSISNLGSMNKLFNESTKLPLIIRAGTSYNHPFTSIPIDVRVNGDIVSFPKESKTHLHFGAETDYKNMIALRFGYQTGYETKSFSAGVGIRSSLFQFDYAYVPYKDSFGSGHIFSLEIQFQ